MGSVFPSLLSHVYQTLIAQVWIDTTSEGRHIGAAVNTDTSQHETPGFEPVYQVGSFCEDFLYSPSSFHMHAQICALFVDS